MGFGRSLSMEQDAVMADHILLTEHTKEKGILFFVIKGGDPFGDVRKRGMFQGFHGVSGNDLVRKDYTDNGRKGQQKNAVAPETVKDEPSPGEDKNTLSDFLLYSLYDLGDQFLNIDAELNDIQRQAFLETILALTP